ncbi:MAG: molybdopterin-dependent oxidoreductase, partial [Rickettsiales bacterium]
GAAYDVTYPVEQLGNNPQVLAEIASGKHPVAEALKNAKKPVVILGYSATAREDGAAILAAAKAIGALCQREGHNGFNMLHHAAARVGALDVGFLSGKDMGGIIEAVEKKDIKLLYLLGVDEIDTTYFGDAFVIYQGHHGDIGAHRADVILPAAAYTEKDGLYVNTEGRVQEGFRAVFPVGEAKEDWQIIARLASILGKPLAFHSLDTLRAALLKAHPTFANIGNVVAAAFKENKLNDKITATPFDYPIENFYRTCPISRASKTMAQCTELVLKHDKKAA